MYNSKLTVIGLICSIIAIVVAGFSDQNFDLNDVAEGPCISVHDAPNFDLNFLIPPRMWTIAGGSKYFLYHISAGFPVFPSLREFEFYYYSCLQAWIDIPSKNITLYGFGQNIEGDDINFETGEEKFSPSTTITLMDNKAFVVVAKCFGTQRAWGLFTIGPDIITTEFQKVIEDHVISLGFERKNFVFFRHDYCKDIQVGNHSGQISY